MDAVIALTGILRLGLVAVVFYLNCHALLKVCFKSNLCMHNMICTAVILANILYLILWPPFLLYGLSNGNWNVVDEQVYCLSQNYVVNAMGMVFLSLLVVRLCDCVRERVFHKQPLGGTQNVTITFFMWILPQLLYDLISFSANQNLCQNPVFHFLNEIIRFVPHDSSIGYSVGFMVCEQELTDVMLTFHLWQYLILVLPLALLTLVLAVMLLVASTLKRVQRKWECVSYWSEWRLLDNDMEFKSTKSCESVCQAPCKKRMVVVDLVLCSNLIWHLIGRPLMILHSIYMQSNDQVPPGFLDVGSHLMLAVSCCFVPTICCTRDCGGGGTGKCLFTIGQRNHLPSVSLIRVNATKDCPRNTKDEEEMPFDVKHVIHIDNINVQGKVPL